MLPFCDGFGLFSKFPLFLEFFNVFLAPEPLRKTGILLNSKRITGAAFSATGNQSHKISLVKVEDKEKSYSEGQKLLIWQQKVLSLQIAVYAGLLSQTAGLDRSRLQKK